MEEMVESMTGYFGNTYRGKRVLVFGHTGFKGSWLGVWLRELGAIVAGASLGKVSEPSHFDAAHLDEVMATYTLDIRDLDSVRRVVEHTQPDFVFHLAAQALVRQSYQEPVATMATNALGTAHVLEALRALKKPCVAVLITSDKCYENIETYYGYRETDALGGKDPYSASKGAAEIIIHSYVHSFFTSPAEGVRIGVARAGNVVGGGDWAVDRLIPDVVRAWTAGESVSIRNPAATRPWQHVLEPLSGYLRLGAELSRRAELHGEPFNFGPKTEDVYPVADVAEHLRQRLPGLKIERTSQDENCFHEAGLLKLSCDKALRILKWRPVLSFKETMDLTADWYRVYYQEADDHALETTKRQLAYYCGLAGERGSSWV